MYGPTPPPTELTKQQFEKLMRRPSMSELDESVARVNRRNQRTLHKENTFVDKLVKINLTDHHKKTTDFVKVQTSKLAAQNKQQGLGRRSFDSSFTDKRLSASFQRWPTFDRQNSRSSLQLNNFPGPSAYGEEVWTLPRRRRHSLMDRTELTAPKNSNRTLEIRQKLYREFNMPERNRRHRPWSPSYALSVVETTQNENSRRQSEPGYRPSDKLSKEIAAKLTYIATGQMPSYSTPDEPENNSSENEPKEFSDGFMFDAGSEETNQTTKETKPSVDAKEKPAIEPSPPATKPTPAQQRQRRKSEVLRKPDMSLRPVQPRRRYSETTNKMNTSILPPLAEANQ